jgi:hypothetical protein
MMHGWQLKFESMLVPARPCSTASSSWELGPSGVHNLLRITAAYLRWHAKNSDRKCVLRISR